MNLHPKIKAAAIAALAVIAASVAAWANGSVGASDAFATAVAGLIPVLVGYFKADTSNAAP